MVSLTVQHSAVKDSMRLDELQVAVEALRVLRSSSLHQYATDQQGMPRSMQSAGKGRERACDGAYAIVDCEDMEHGA